MVTLFTVAKSGKQPKCPSTGEWINKLWYIQAVEYNSVINRIKLLVHTITWMNLKIIILNDRIQI